MTWDKTWENYKYNIKHLICCLSAGGQAKVFMPGFLFLETSLLLLATKTNSSSQALMCRNLTTSEASTELWQCQTTGDRLRGDIPHAHTHSPLHTLWAWETWAQTKQLDCTVLLTVLFLWAKWQVGFEGKTNASTVPLAFSPHFLKEIVFWVVWCLCLLPAERQTHTMASWRSKQERQPHSSLLGQSSDPLSSHSESPRDDCSVIFLQHRGQSVYIPWFKTPSSMSSSSLKSMKASTWARHCVTHKKRRREKERGKNQCGLRPVN